MQVNRLPPPLPPKGKPPPRTRGWQLKPFERKLAELAHVSARQVDLGQYDSKHGNGCLYLHAIVGYCRLLGMDGSQPTYHASGIVISFKFRGSGTSIPLCGCACMYVYSFHARPQSRATHRFRSGLFTWLGSPHVSVPCVHQSCLPECGGLSALSKASPGCRGTV